MLAEVGLTRPSNPDGFVQLLDSWRLHLQRCAPQSCSWRPCRRIGASWSAAELWSHGARGTETWVVRTVDLQTDLLGEDWFDHYIAPSRNIKSPLLRPDETFLGAGFLFPNGTIS